LERLDPRLTNYRSHELRSQAGDDSCSAAQLAFHPESIHPGSVTMTVRLRRSMINYE
jgi:hypothetical protein